MTGRRSTWPVAAAIVLALGLAGSSGVRAQAGLVGQWLTLPILMLNAGRPASDLVVHFKENNVLIPRPFAGFNTCLRVSLGTPLEMREFWRVWDLLPAHKMSM
jgi:hypothetical protein